MILEQEKARGWGTPRPEYEDILKRHPSRMTRTSMAVARGPNAGRVKDSEGHEGQGLKKSYRQRGLPARPTIREDPTRPKEERVVEPSAKVQQWGSHNDQTLRMRGR